MKPIDIHIHGIGSGSAAIDTRGASANRILEMAAICGRQGLHAFVPTIYPAPLPVMRRDMAAIAMAMESPVRAGSARIAGIHLEGPFINPMRCGALDPSAALPPTLRNLAALLSEFEPFVKIITLAPELRGALKLIERCTALGIRVSLGHSDATAQQAAEAARAGAVCVTHLFNAMGPLHHREPGLAGFALTDEHLYVELIADGIHVCPDVLKMVFQIKPSSRIILVSDSVKGPQRRGGVLQGAKQPLLHARDVLLPLGVKPAHIDRAMSANPARMLGLRMI